MIIYDNSRKVDMRPSPEPIWLGKTRSKKIMKLEQDQATRTVDKDRLPELTGSRFKTPLQSKIISKQRKITNALISNHNKDQLPSVHYKKASFAADSEMDYPNGLLSPLGQNH